MTRSDGEALAAGARRRGRRAASRPQRSPQPVAATAKYSTPTEVAEFVGRAARGLSRAEAALLIRYVGAGTRVFDLGCGAGREALPLANRHCRVVAVDVALPLLRAGQDRGSGVPTPPIWLLADAMALPLVSRPVFEAVLLLDQFIEHFHGRSVRIGLLRRLARLLRPGGVLLASTHNQLWTPGLRRLLWKLHERRRPPSGEPAAEATVAGPSVRAQARPVRRVAERALQIAKGHLEVGVSNVARRATRWLRGPAYGGAEPGDFWVERVSPANSAGSVAFHPYLPAEFEADAHAAGLSVEACLDSSELEDGRDHPRWLRLGAPKLFWVLKRRVGEAGAGSRFAPGEPVWT